MKIIWLVIILAILGIFDSSYLAAEHYLGSPIYCPIGGECEKVLNSAYSNIGGIPLALFGAALYFLTLILALIYQTSQQKYLQRYLLRALCILMLLAFIFSTWLVYLQMFVIKAICMYCMISAINVTVLFAISIYLIKADNKQV